MAGKSPASDVVFDLVSIQYHALKAQEAYPKYLQDASGNDAVKKFFEQVQKEDAQRAETCHKLLADLTKSGGISNAA